MTTRQDYARMSADMIRRERDLHRGLGQPLPKDLADELKVRGMLGRKDAVAR